MSETLKKDRTRGLFSALCYPCHKCRYWFGLYMVVQSVPQEIEVQFISDCICVKVHLQTHNLIRVHEQHWYVLLKFSASALVCYPALNLIIFLFFLCFFTGESSSSALNSASTFFSTLT
jgi:hypothetical protein